MANKTVKLTFEIQIDPDDTLTIMNEFGSALIFDKAFSKEVSIDRNMLLELMKETIESQETNETR